MKKHGDQASENPDTDDTELSEDKKHMFRTALETLKYTVPYKEGEEPEIRKKLREFVDFVQVEADKREIGFFIEAFKESSAQKESWDGRTKQVRTSHVSIHEASLVEVANGFYKMLSATLPENMDETQRKLVSHIRMLTKAMSFLADAPENDTCTCSICSFRRELLLQESTPPKEKSTTTPSKIRDPLSLLHSMVSNLKNEGKTPEQKSREILESFEKPEKGKLH